MDPHGVRPAPPAPVSVIVPAYNCAPFIGKALDSALAQTHQPLEIIVVNDGSTDDTPRICREYERRHPDRVRYYSQANAGTGAARNTAIRHAHGSLLALLDGDDEWLPDRLEAGVEVMSRQPEVGLVHGNIDIVDVEGRLIETPSRVPAQLSGWIFESLLLRTAHISCPTVLLRRSCLDSVGGFDEARVCMGVADRDLWLRVSHRFPAVYLDRVVARYRILESSLSRNVQGMHDGRLYSLEKICSLFDVPERMKRAALAAVFWYCADEFLRTGNYAKARTACLSSLAHEPRALSTWKLLAKALWREILAAGGAQ